MTIRIKGAVKTVVGDLLGILLFLFEMIALYVSDTDVWKYKLVYRQLGIILGLILFIFMVYHAAIYCKTIVLSREGCEIRWLGMRRFHTWDQMKCIKWVMYTKHPAYLGGFWFSVKPVRLPAGYLAYKEEFVVNPLNAFCLHFAPKVKFRIMDRNAPTQRYEVNREEFIEFVRYAGIVIEDLPDYVFEEGC